MFQDRYRNDKEAVSVLDHLWILSTPFISTGRDVSGSPTLTRR